MWADKTHFDGMKLILSFRSVSASGPCAGSTTILLMMLKADQHEQEEASADERFYFNNVTCP